MTAYVIAFCALIGPPHQSLTPKPRGLSYDHMEEYDRAKSDDVKPSSGWPPCGGPIRLS